MRKFTLFAVSLFLAGYGFSKPIEGLLQEIEKHECCSVEMLEKATAEDAATCQKRLEEGDTTPALFVLAAGLEQLKKLSMNGTIYDRLKSILETSDLNHCDNLLIFASIVHCLTTNTNLVTSLKQTIYLQRNCHLWTRKVLLGKAVDRTLPLYTLGNQFFTQPSDLLSSMGVAQTLTCLGLIAPDLTDPIKTFLQVEDLETFAVSLKQLAQDVSAHTGLGSSFANALFALFSNRYENVTIPAFENAGAKQLYLDFTQPESAAQTVNGLAAEIMQGHLSSVVSPENFSPDTALVLTSILHFKGKWEGEKAEINFQGTKVEAFSFVETYMRFMHNANTYTSYAALPLEGGYSFVVRHSPYGTYYLTPEDIRELMDQKESPVNSFTAPCLAIELKKNLLQALPEDLSNKIQSDFYVPSLNKLVNVKDFTQTLKLNLDDKGAETSAFTFCGIVEQGVGFEINIDSPYTYAIIHENTLFPVVQGIIQDTTFMTSLVNRESEQDAEFGEIIEE